MRDVGRRSRDDDNGDVDDVYVDIIMLLWRPNYLRLWTLVLWLCYTALQTQTMLKNFIYLNIKAMRQLKETGAATSAAIVVA